MKRQGALCAGRPPGAAGQRESLETIYPPYLASAAQMRDALRAYLARHAVHADVVCQVVLAADEAFVNALTHSDSGDAIQVRACVSEDEAVVEVQDAGSGFAYRGSRPKPTPDAASTNGRGVFLIENMMDSVSVVSGHGGTTVRMVRRLV